MSLILDALNRSRTDSDQIPNLGTRHDYAGDGAASNSRQWMLASALLLALLVIAWLLWERIAPGQVAEPVAPAPVLAEPVAVSKPPPEPVKPVSTATISVKDSTVSQPPTKTSAQVKPEPSAGVSSQVSALYEQGPSPATTLRSAAASSEPEPQVVDQPSAPARTIKNLEESGVDIERLVRQAEADLENARLAEHPAPFVSALSQQTKDSIPTIYYQQHSYSGLSGQSRVVLNGKELKSGGSPASGVKIKEILPDSVVLDYRGTEFRLRALNSWVNL